MEKYEIKETIGQGGMAVVYKAYQKKLGRLVAIKRLHPHLLQDQEVLSRFEREARSLASLKHHNIVTIYDFDKDAETHFIVMEYVEGKNLEVLLKEKPIPLVIGVFIIKEICEALHYAHEQGIIHRDLKPTNILIENTGCVKIMDFGIARLLKLGSITKSKSIIGTPAYMSPEQVKGEVCTVQSDIFSLGILFYQLLTNQLPFQGDDVATLTYQIAHEPFVPPERINPEVTPELSKIISRALAKGRAKRYSGVQMMKRDIGRYLEKFKIEESIEAELKNFLRQPSYLEEIKKKSIVFHLERGEDFQKAQNFEEARAELKAVLNLSPKNQEAIKLLQTLPQPVVRKFSSALATKMKLLALFLLLALLGFLIRQNFLWVSKTSPPAEKKEKETLPSEQPRRIEPGTSPLPLRGEKEETRREKTSELLPPSQSPKRPLFSAKDTARSFPPGPPPKVEIKSGSLLVYSDPWAEVYIDGEKRGHSPMKLSERIKLKAGPHLLKLVSEKGDVYEEKIIIQPKKVLKKSIKGGWLKIHSSLPDIFIQINQGELKKLPSQPLNLPVGEHLITLYNPQKEILSQQKVKIILWQTSHLYLK